jgi:methyl-accepting chemotaxis protein
MVEKSTAASHDLAKEAVALTSLLGQFRVNDSEYGLDTAQFRARSIVRPSEPARSIADYKARPAASPARALARKLSSAFGGGGSVAVASTDPEWTEF